MSIVDGTGLVTWEGGLFEPGSDLLHRVQWAFGKIRADGGTIHLNEAGRPFGEPGDMLVRNPWQTKSGISTVWFQWGRYQRGETPSAANPNSGALASEHTQGKAIDCDAPTVFDATLRAEYFHQVGMVQTISSESWHWAIRGNPSVNIASSSVTAIPNTPTQKPRPKDEDMMIYSSTSENGRCYLVTPYEVSPVDDSNSAKQLAILLTGDPEGKAPKVNGDQINIFRKETERARLQLGAHLAARK